MKYQLLLFLAFTGLAGLTVTAQGQAIITSPSGTNSIALGVNSLGHLNLRTGNIVQNASATGLAYASTAPGHPTGGLYYDATAPGCLCEGWGVSAGGVSGYANVSVDGAVNLTLDSFASTASTATSKVFLTSLPGLSVEQAYAPAVPGALFEDAVTITNNTGATLTDVRYVRVMDWDVPFTEFNEFVTIQGTATTTDLETSHDNGFSTANPLAATSPILAGTLDTDFIDVGPYDHGAYFRFNFGDLPNGESTRFKVYYGAAPTERGMLAALGTVGIELYSLGQSSNNDPVFPGDPLLGTPITYAFGFSGVGGDVILPPPGGAVPEPAAIAVWTSLAAIGVALSCRKRFARTE